MPVQIKFYTDTHIAKAVAVQLQSKGVDIIRCEDVGMAEAGDLEHLEYTASTGRTIVTNDQGFTGHHRWWLQAGRQHAGIFLITHDKENIGMIVMALLFWHEAVAAGAADLANDVYNQIQFIP
jgi:hypothetical protein